jgi:hypothetical protein
LEEINSYIDRAKNTNIAWFYFKAKSIVQRYNDQDQHIINLLAADIVLSHFQDLFSTIHYVNVVGPNEAGKSSIGYTFEYTGYRVVKATSISAPNYYRTLGTIEPGQCTIIEDEADNIEEDSDKMRILKSGYEYNAKVPKINMNTSDQRQNWFYAYSFKIIIAENSLDPDKAKGLLERTLICHCKPSNVDREYTIKDVVSNSYLGNSTKQQLRNELTDFRKLMLCYRLVHYRDPPISDNNHIGSLRNRDKELCGPLVQLFEGTEALPEIISALDHFLDQRKERKANSIEAALYPLIIDLIEEEQIYESSQGVIWKLIVGGKYIKGRYDPKKPDQYQTEEYGTLYRNKIGRKILDTFGSGTKRKNNGTIIIFSKEKLRRFENTYSDILHEKNVPEQQSEGSVGSEGSRVCGFIIEEIQE